MQAAGGCSLSRIASALGAVERMGLGLAWPVVADQKDPLHFLPAAVSGFFQTYQ